MKPTQQYLGNYPSPFDFFTLDNFLVWRNGSFWAILSTSNPQKLPLILKRGKRTVYLTLNPATPFFSVVDLIVAATKGEELPANILSQYLLN